MTDLPPTPSEDEARDNGIPREKSEDRASMEALRELILGAERRQIEAIQQYLADRPQRARDMGEVLAEAIQIRMARDDGIAKALSPTIADILRTSIRKDSKALGDALFPVMGPAIRKAITSTIWSMIESLNQILEHSVSLRGLKWRLEAIRTRKSFAEIVLLHTMVYRVEQILLIVAESGVLLQHVVAREVSMEDPDLVSGMLTAIQDFARDSFGASTDDTLETLRMGDRHVLVEQQGGLTLAAVIRGTPPPDFGLRIQGVLETILLKKPVDLEDFDGNPDAFEMVRPDLEDCLETKIQEEKKRPSPLLWAIPGIVLILLGIWLHQDLDQKRQWHRFIDRIREQPGMAVIATEKRSGQIHVHGLKDPLAALPANLSAEFPAVDTPTVRFHWKPFRSLDPQMVLARLSQRLPPLKTVSLHLENGCIVASGTALPPWLEAFREAAADLDESVTIDAGNLVDGSEKMNPLPGLHLSLDGTRLVAEGNASHQWIVSARRIANGLAGVTHYDDTAVMDTDQAAVADLKERIQAGALYFSPGISRLNDRQRRKLKELAADLTALFARAAILDKPVHLAVIGQADTQGAADYNLEISQARADAVRDQLIEFGMDGKKIIGIGIGEAFDGTKPESGSAGQSSRRVAFAVREGQAPWPDG